MRIGFDASMLGGEGGIAIYSEHLLAALGCLCGGKSLVLWAGSRATLPAVRRLTPRGGSVVMPGLAGRLLGRWGRVAWNNPFPIEAFVGPVDVFHGPNYLLPAQRGKAALIVTVHDLSALRHPEWHPPRRALMHRLALRRTLERTDHVMTDTESVRAEVIEALAISPGRVTAITPAASPIFRPSPPQKLAPSLARWALSPGEYLLYAGAIEPRKNIGRLLDVVAALRGRREDLPPLVLVGPRGWRNREICARIAGAGPRTRYLGHVPREDLASIMAGSSAFVLPSLYEGFGLPVLEAMASGVPVVASRGGALEELAKDAAILVDPLDIESIAAGIERVLDDSDLREALTRKGLARAAEFSWDRTARETLQVYERAIAAKQRLR